MRKQYGVSGEAVNSSVNPDDVVIYEVFVRVPGGTKLLRLSLESVRAYNADPDGFTAKTFNLSRDDYREWITLDGAALCGAQTTSGRMCRSVISRAQLSAEEWKGRHREGRCFSHDGSAAEK